MLAIDRLKKLKLAAKRNAQQNAELFQASPLPADHCRSHISPSVVYESPSKLCIGPQKSPSYFVAANNEICRRSGESLYAAHPWPLAPHQPEMVAIQVKRSTNVQSPAVYDAPISPAGCESFHGVPVQDAFVGRITSPYDNTGAIRVRRASDDLATSPYSMLTPPPCVGSGGGAARLPYSRGSAPSTPLHTTSRLTPSAVTPTKVPPAPPQRTNSVKVNDSPLVTDANRGQCRLANCGSLDRMSKNNRASVRTACDTDAGGAVPCSAAACATAAVMSTTVETGSSGDCSTLPFANENIGTIRQRGSLNASSAAHRVNDGDDDSDEKPVYDEYSGTVRRRGRFSVTRVNLCFSSRFLFICFKVPGGSVEVTDL